MGRGLGVASTKRNVTYPRMVDRFSTRAIRGAGLALNIRILGRLWAGLLGFMLLACGPRVLPTAVAVVLWPIEGSRSAAGQPVPPIRITRQRGLNLSTTKGVNFRCRRQLTSLREATGPVTTNPGRSYFVVQESCSVSKMGRSESSWTSTTVRQALKQHRTGQNDRSTDSARVALTPHRTEHEFFFTWLLCSSIGTQRLRNWHRKAGSRDPVCAQEPVAIQGRPETPLHPRSGSKMFFWSASFLVLREWLVEPEGRLAWRGRSPLHRESLRLRLAGVVTRLPVFPSSQRNRRPRDPPTAAPKQKSPNYERRWLHHAPTKWALEPRAVRREQVHGQRKRGPLRLGAWQEGWAASRQQGVKDLQKQAQSNTVHRASAGSLTFSRASRGCLAATVAGCHRGNATRPAQVFWAAALRLKAVRPKTKRGLVHISASGRQLPSTDRDRSR